MLTSEVFGTDASSSWRADLQVVLFVVDKGNDFADAIRDDDRTIKLWSVLSGEGEVGKNQTVNLRVKLWERTYRSLKE